MCLILERPHNISSFLFSDAGEKLVEQETTVPSDITQLTATIDVGSGGDMDDTDIEGSGEDPSLTALL